MPFLYLQFLLWILVGAFAGWLTGKKLKRYGYGPVLDVCMGMIGAVGGVFLIGAPAFSGPRGMIPTLLASLTGAIVLTMLMAWASGERRHAWAGEKMQQGQQANRRLYGLSQPEDDTLY
jgi:uncharacterized membrane protein YeaQ/YmgE (transglycosylase-associated protein family)